MIDPDALCPVGTITKAHGLRGEVVCQFLDEAAAGVPTDHLLLLVEGIPVPFFIVGRRERGALGAILRFDDVDTADQAAALVGCQALLERDSLAFDEDDEEAPSLRYFIGFTLEDTTEGEVGEIIDVDDQTANLLFIVQTSGGEELLVPAHPDLIVDIDHRAGFVTMRLPEGLLDPDRAEEIPDTTE